MPGRPTAIHLTLSSQDWLRLLQWQRDPATHPRLVRRARLILHIADGMPIAQAARLVGMGRVHVYLWLRRWQEQGLGGLVERKRGRVPPITQKGHHHAQR